MASHLIVQIHLNLAQPGLAENVVRVQSQSGAWVGVAYATELVLSHVHPVVDQRARLRIEHGEGKKTPHAFLQGTLLHFKGRLREKAPLDLQEQVQPFLTPSPDFEALYQESVASGQAINYNPRFATCFYQDQPDKSSITQQFERAETLMVLGWQCVALQGQFSPLLPENRCHATALERTSLFEKLAIQRGKKTTQERAIRKPFGFE